MNTLSDNPASTTGVIGVFVLALIGLLQGFGILHITAEQITLLMSFLAALWALSTWLLSRLTVPRTPSGTGSGIVQTPPPGTVLVTSESAAAPKAVPAGSIVAGPTPTS